MVRCLLRMVLHLSLRISLAASFHHQQSATFNIECVHICNLPSINEFRNKPAESRDIPFHSRWWSSTTSKWFVIRIPTKKSWCGIRPLSTSSRRAFYPNCIQGFSASSSSSTRCISSINKWTSCSDGRNTQSHNSVTGRRKTSFFISECPRSHATLFKAISAVAAFLSSILKARLYEMLDRCGYFVLRSMHGLALRAMRSGHSLKGIRGPPSHKTHQGRGRNSFTVDSRRSRTDEAQTASHKQTRFGQRFKWENSTRIDKLSGAARPQLPIASDFHDCFKDCFWVSLSFIWAQVVWIFRLLVVETLSSARFILGSV